jgi:hypothetical protein
MTAVGGPLGDDGRPPQPNRPRELPGADQSETGQASYSAPLVVLPPLTVPLSAEQADQAVAALTELLASWLDNRPHAHAADRRVQADSGHGNEDGGQPPP